MRSTTFFTKLHMEIFGAVERGLILRWANSERSREVLGYPEMIRWLTAKRAQCHPSNIESVEAELDAARRDEGQTLFDVLVEIIETHCPEEREDRVELQLA